MRKKEKGQALLLVILALGIFLIGGIGLAIDGAQLYAQREMAQAAADAAAQAGVFSIFAGTGGTGYGTHTVGTAFTCTTTDTSTPCVYAQKNGFGLGADDTVAVSFPSSPYNGVAGSTDFVNPFEQVTITRTVHTSLMRFLGSSTSTVKAIGGAGIVQPNSPVPIILLHPTLPNLSLGGNSEIQICGGPSKSIQLNSANTAAVSVSGNAFIDLSKAGTADTSMNCTTGTGANFGNTGGPTAASSACSGTMSPCILLGSTGNYVQPAAPIRDPLLSVTAPAPPAAAPARVSISSGVDGCTSSNCYLYSPGKYTGGLSVAANDVAVFKPGVYYMDAGDFSLAGNGQMIMCSGCGTSTDTGNTGMLVYLHTSGTLQVAGNGRVNLLGSAPSSTYKGILFFSDHAAPAQTHTLGGNGNLLLNGTVYLTSATHTTSSVYQTINFGGNACSTTVLVGEVITDVISMGGNSCIKMELSPSYTLPIDQVALVK